MTQPERERGDGVAGRRSLAAALIVHLVVLAAVRATPPPKAEAAPPLSPLETAEVDVAIETTPAAPNAGGAMAQAAPEGQTARVAAVIRPPSAARSGSAGGAAGTETETAGEAGAGSPSGTSTGGPTDPSANAPERPVMLTVPHAPTAEELGIGANPFLPRSEAKVEAAETKRRAEAALRDPLAERDRKLGLGPEGPVLTALAESTAQSIAPVRGRAVFVATSNALGEIVSLELLDAEGTGGRPSWADAGRIAFDALRTKKVRIPPGKTKAVMKIEVVSAWKMPSGQDPGNNITLMHIPLSKGEGKDSPTTEFLTPKIQVVPIEIAPGVKVPIVSLQLNLVSTNIDPTNVGAKPQRVIHTRLLDSSVM